MSDHAQAARWVAAYEAAWRAAGTDSLTELFTDDATYLVSPYATPIRGLAAIAAMWEAEREGPGEVFTMESEVLAVDADVAVFRVLVRYGDPPTQEYSDLWVVRLADDGRAHWFEEWPFWPGAPRTGDGDASPRG